MFFDTKDYNTLDEMLRKIEGCCRTIRKNIQSDNPARGEIKACCEKIDEMNNLLNFVLVKSIKVYIKRED